MNPDAISSLAEKTAWHFSSLQSGLLFLGCLLVPFIYYAAVWRTGRRVLPRTGLIYFSPPRGLSPAEMRYVMHRETDARSLIVCLIAAAVKNCYRIRWFKKGFVAHLEPWSDFDVLSDAEKRALSFAPNRYWEQVVISPKTSTRTRKMQQRLRQYMRQRFGSAFNLRMGWMIGGISLSILSLSLALGIQGGGWLVGWGILYSLLAVGFVLAPLFFITVAWQDRYWFGLFVSLVMLFIGGWVLSTIEGFSGIPLLAVMVFPLAFLNVYFIRLLPTWSPAGHMLAMEIAGYRHYLEKKLTYLEESGKSVRLLQEELPYVMALNLDQKLGLYFNQLLSKTEYDPFSTLNKVVSGNA